ncbi:hypothetical protein C8Q75DRAFT_734156 [Abortiporus biennis]|nr:hypothetical protein C8Q75DRAFT_734156 [Abortiporus biennis]
MLNMKDSEQAQHSESLKHSDALDQATDTPDATETTEPGTPVLSDSTNVQVDAGEAIAQSMSTDSSSQSVASYMSFSAALAAFIPRGKASKPADVKKPPPTGN